MRQLAPRATDLKRFRRNSEKQFEMMAIFGLLFCLLSPVQPRAELPSLDELQNYYRLKAQFQELQVEMHRAQEQYSRLASTANLPLILTEAGERERQGALETARRDWEAYANEVRRLRGKLEHSEARVRVIQIHYLNGKLTEELSSLESRGDCLWEIRGNQIFSFDSFEAERAWTTWRDSLEDRARLAAARSATLRICARDSSVNSNSPVKVDTRSSTRCGGSEVNYTLMKREDGLLQIDATVVLTYLGKETLQDVVDGRIADVRACVQEFYADQGLVLNLTLDTNADLASGDSTPIFSEYTDQAQRTYSDYWGILGDQGRPLDKPLLCSLLAHELGHRLGLPDRYPDPKGCPGRDPNELAPVWSVMNKGGHRPASQLRLEERDLELLVKPLCGP